MQRSEEHTSELQSHRDLHSFPTRRSSDLWDFEWSNRQMMRNMYIRQQSFFSNTDLAARKLPDAAELAILEPLRGQIPDEVFTQVFEAPKTDGSGNIRDKQLQALDLL